MIWRVIMFWLLAAFSAVADLPRHSSLGSLQVEQFAYNGLDELNLLADGNSHTTSWAFNQYGWRIGKTNATGTNIINYTRDANGRVTNRWMMGTNTGYKLDAVGNVTNIVYPATNIAIGYDAVNRPTNMMDISGTASFTWTPTSHLASETGLWASDTTSYGYSQGHRTNLNLSQPSGSWNQTYLYDAAWRMTGIGSPAGSFTYQYASGANQYRVGGILLPNGASIVNQYDNLSRLTNTALLDHWGHVLDGYVYGLDALGQKTNLTRQLGLSTNNVAAGYDAIGQITNWAGKEAGGANRQNEQMAYGYDLADNLISRTNNALVQTFTVDSLNQLNNVSRSGTFTVSGALPAPPASVTVNGAAAQTNGDFTFAATNNTLANGNNTFTIIAENIYGTNVTNVLSVNLPATVTFQYDANGNLTSDGTRTFQYDAENQLTNVNVSGQWQVGYVYDGLGRRRIRRAYAWQSGWSLTNETRYIYDGPLVIQERDTNNNILVTYTRGLDLSGSLFGAGGIGGLLARTDTNGTLYYHCDGGGNITALMDEYQRIVARYEYDAYGRLIGMWGSLASANTYRFSSKEYDALSGLYYYGHRYYDPALQRWPNPDPIGEAGGINLYRAMRNNPMRWVDPFGLDNMYNMAAGNNAPPSMVVSANPSLGEAPTVTYQGSQGDLFLIGEFSTAAGTVAAASIMGLIAGGVPPDQAIMLVEQAYEKLVNNASPQPSQNNCPNNTSPIKTPLMGMAKPNNGGGPPHGGSLHDQMINDFIDNLPDEADNIRKNQQQVDFFGNPVGNNRPDVQYDLDGVHYNIEFDMNWMKSITHFDEIFENDSVSSIEIHF